MRSIAEGRDEDSIVGSLGSTFYISYPQNYVEENPWQDYNVIVNTLLMVFFQFGI